MDTPVSSKEWNFSSVLRSEAKACLLWEIARESVYIHNLAFHWDEVIARQPSAPLTYLWPFLNRGSTGFPTKPWLAFSSKERKSLSRHLMVTELVVIRGTEMAEKMLTQQPNVELPVTFDPEEEPNFSPTTEVSTLEDRRDSLYVVIQPRVWREYTNKQIALAVDEAIRAGRPRGIAEPKPTRGQRNDACIAALRWVAAMRLRHNYSMPEVLDAARPDIEESFFYDESGMRWGEERAFREARDQATAKMHECFPFLPEEEKPLSYPIFGD